MLWVSVCVCYVCQRCEAALFLTRVVWDPVWGRWCCPGLRGRAQSVSRVVGCAVKVGGDSQSCASMQ